MNPQIVLLFIVINEFLSLKQSKLLINYKAQFTCQKIKSSESVL